VASAPEPRRPHNRPSRQRSGADAEGVRSVAQLLKAARTAFYREEEEDALEMLLEALRLAPTNLHVHYLAALCADLLSEEDTLEDVCGHALEVDSRHPYAVACEAVRYLYLSNFSRAEDLFNKALEMLPDELDLQIGLGILHEYSGEDDKGVEAFQRALELDPENVRARVSLGIAYAMSGEYQNALIEYRRAKEIDPETENPHQRLGRDYYLDGVFEEAASEFGQAMAEEPDEPAAYFYLMDCSNRLGRVDEALDIYETIRSRFGNEPELTSGFYEYFRMNREAVAALEVLAGRTPEDAELQLRLAGLYKETGNLDKATEAAEAATRLDPEQQPAWTLLGSLRLDRGDCAGAVTACRRAVELNPYDQAAYVTLADALLFSGRDKEAQATVEEMERNRQEAWHRYQDKFSGQDRADSDR
jgi:tetratricopeptide (TPR) repeat protein